MLQSTQAIVLHYVSYTESSVICKMYTRNYGLQSYLIRGVRQRKSKTGTSFLQPLSVVEITANHSKAGALKTVREVRLSQISKTISVDPVKRALAIFVNEVLYKTLREEEADNELFDFLINSISYLDIHDRVANFHLVFLLKLSRFYGFFPVNNFDSKSPIFDLTEGIFTPDNKEAAEVMSKEESEVFSRLITAGFNFQLQLSKIMRKNLLHYIIRYYRLHVDGLGEIKSLDILEIIFAD